MRSWGIALALVFALQLGCASGAHVTDREIASYGSKRFSGSKEDVFAAVEAGLRAMGYKIANENPQKGLIHTDRKFVRQDAVTDTLSSEVYGIHYTRQYVIRVETTPDGMLVTATPRFFANDQEITSEPIWDLPSEQQLWKQLFDEVALQL